MNRHTDILDTRLVEMNNELVNDLKLDDISIKEKSLKAPALKAKWLQVFFEEDAYLKKLERARDELFDQYVKEHGEKNIPKYVTEKEVEKSEDLKALDIAIKQQRNVIRFVEGALELMRQFGWDIKNSISLIQLENA
jgi:hypothetical protein